MQRCGPRGRRRRCCITVGLSPLVGPVRRQAHPCPSRGIWLLRGRRHRHDSRGVAASTWDPGAARGAGGRLASASAGLESGTDWRFEDGGAREEPGGIEGLFAAEHVVDGAGEFVSEDGEGLGLPVLLGQVSHEALRRGILAQAPRLKRQR